MNCPVCDDSRMREVEKNGILIDVCPACKGVWLDRGELDKLMTDVREVREDYNQWHYRDDDDDDDRRKRANYSQPPQYNQPGNYNQGHNPNAGHDLHYGNHKGPYKKKKKSVLDVFGDLFD
ncbi:TFIIB-type zinc ribbon-containing protein [Cohnella nanjingensis]|uniref:Zf-TFIIB domain-containing protein n=1 Tax=Cohnella nanjingensis TaxID=1387779 RepID=A0A7X0RMQ7_9BACL|nr:zf-TFIIB domain-containing protein [Cohnella nanjingensis]MBB6670322.1 zf-TFIIB domain-containing protein [Cohnella nanjingensis]